MIAVHDRSFQTLSDKLHHDAQPKDESVLGREDHPRRHGPEEVQTGRQRCQLMDKDRLRWLRKPNGLRLHGDPCIRVRVVVYPSMQASDCLDRHSGRRTLVQGAVEGQSNGAHRLMRAFSILARSLKRKGRDATSRLVKETR